MRPVLSGGQSYSPSNSVMHLKNTLFVHDRIPFNFYLRLKERRNTLPLLYSIFYPLSSLDSSSLPASLFHSPLSLPFSSHACTHTRIFTPASSLHSFHLRMQYRQSNSCSSTPCSRHPLCRCLDGPSFAVIWTRPPTLPRMLIWTASHWKVRIRHLISQQFLYKFKKDQTSLLHDQFTRLLLLHTAILYSSCLDHLLKTDGSTFVFVSRLHHNLTIFAFLLKIIPNLKQDEHTWCFCDQCCPYAFDNGDIWTAYYI